MNFSELFHLSILHGYIPQLLLAEAVFFFRSERKPGFPLRLPVGLAVLSVCAVALPNLIAHFASGFFSMTIFLLTIPFWAFLMEGRLTDILFCCIAGQLVQNLSSHVENLIYLPFADHFSLTGRFLLSVTVMLIVYAAAFVLLSGRVESGEGQKHRFFIIGFSVVTTLFVYVMQYLFQVYGIDRIWITRPPLVLCCIFALCVQFGILALGREKENSLLLEQMIAKEHHQYELTRENMDALNRKAHDLKHQIARLRSMESADRDELQEIEDVVSQYELTYHTGNTTVDTILSEKQLICRQHQIDLSVIAQDGVLDFLRPGEIASLLGNALDNAIEYEMKIEQADRRCIFVRLYETKGLACFRVENYCPQEPSLEDGLPVTTKQDRMNHGFGLRSIQYIAQQHSGSANLYWKDHLFVLHVLMQPS